MGPWDVIKDAIFFVIQWFYDLSGDWGIAIILITILFRLAIYPITHKQFQSTYKMQKLQPKMKAIQERYKDDKARQQQEMANFYKEAKFNPLAGCLPMLLQMPIFIALFQVLSRDYFESHVEGGVPTFLNIIPNLYNAPSYVFFGEETGVISVLPAIPYVILVLIFGVSMLIPMLINKQQENQQRIMMLVMAAFMLTIGWGAPAGVLLYWDISSLIGIGQQYLTQKYLKRKDEAAEEEMIDLEPVKVEIDRKEKKARPRKKG